MKRQQRPLRVLHLLNSRTGAGCGIVNASIDIISGQIRQPVEVAVCSLPGEHLAALDAMGVRHYVLDQRRRVVTLWRAPLQLHRIVKHFRPDVIHCHMVTGVVLARLIAPFHRFLLVAHVHNVHQPSSDFMRIADRVIAVSEAVQRDMERRGIPARKIRMVHNGTLGSVRLADPAGETEKPLMQPSIVTVGGMNHRKGIAELIAAFEIVCEHNPECHLYLVGDGPNRSEFELRARRSRYASQIHFEGFQPNPIPYMKAASVFVLASRRDSFGLVLTEARACACAIVATNVDGIPEALDAGEAGLLVPPQDPPALAAAMARLLEDSEERARLSARAKQNLDRFTVDKMAERILDVYEELVFRSGERSSPTPVDEVAA